MTIYLSKCYYNYIENMKGAFIMIFRKEKKENNTIKGLIVVFAIIVTFTCGYLLGLYSDDNISKKRTNKKSFNT